jgi:hypothetical protein
MSEERRIVNTLAVVAYGGEVHATHVHGST